MKINAIKENFKNVNNFNKIFEVSKKSRGKFQRLEFLGDRVLGLVLASRIYKKYSTYNEGKMAKLYAYLTSGKVLSKISRDIKLHEHLKQCGIKNITNNVLSDYFEAILGAYFLDNGYKETDKLILKIYDKEIKKENTGWGDFKSILQEWSQGHEYGLPTYDLVDKAGPDHNPMFFVEVTIIKYNSVLGKGKSIQLAEQDAAKKFLKIEKIEYEKKS